MSNSRLKIWLSAFRLRTLPLALSCIFMGAALTFSLKKFNIFIFIGAMFTTIFLQVLSNLANDYGDGVKGTDNKDRIGPTRAVQSGEISLNAMKSAIIVTATLSLFSGLTLLFLSFGASHFLLTFFFLLLGIISIAAAIKYTVGENAYGYSGLGDVAVFIFFGLIGVLGSHFLYTQSCSWSHLLLAMCIGLLSVGVLNLNNMRDIENDRASNKNTIPVKLGLEKAKKYHFVLLLSAMLCLVFYVFSQFTSIFGLLPLLVFPIVLNHLMEVNRCNLNRDFNPMLAKLAISTFLLSILFFVGEFLKSIA